ncbi:ABC transporter permease [Natrarchaeobius oligotrophus]|uniref:ABC transporter permease n=1 Tax=Natrarchaeobius chitinivorans TaxID=1679083 RepID=A0A3N6MEE0_NATCH|nr:ABC transporter permease [Natrarchaeobius chitinivorans]RQH02334.1 ABC transporter permease [Natrarchaeobius chitinivorans]
MSTQSLTTVRSTWERARTSVKERIAGTWFERNRGILIRLFAVLVGLTIWDLYARGQPDYLFPGLELIFESLVTQYREDDLVGAFTNSMATMFLGYILAVLVGVPLGLAMGISRKLDVMLNPYVNAMYVAPISAMVPIFILIGGPTFEVRVFIVFLFCVFEILIDTYEGVKTTPEGLLQVAESFGASKYYTVRHVIFPHDLPYITAGLRLGMGRAVNGMILAEILIEFVNLGGIIRSWADVFRVSGVLSIVLMLMLVSIILTRAIQLLERLIIDWEAEK